MFVATFCSIYLEQWWKKSVVRDGKTYTVRFIIHGRLYAIPVRPVLGPAAGDMTPEERGAAAIQLDTS